MNHDVIGPAIRQGLEQGSQLGRHDEALAYTRRLLARRFGVLPAFVEGRLNHLSTDELEDIGVRILDAGSLTDLFEQA
jgi:hypothetical protein